MRTVYVQKKSDGEWLNRNAFACASGFDQRGYEVIGFTPEQLESGEIKPDRHTPVHGGIGTVVSAWNKMGIARPKNFDLPESLRRPEYLYRKVWETTMKETRSLERPIFIKPLEGHKAFTGYVVRCFSDLIRTARFDRDYPLLAQDPVTFLSEFRVFVLQGRAVGSSHYHGKPTKFPDGKIVEKMIADFTDAPAAYSLDVGVIDLSDNVNQREETALVEVNDAFALGCYGLDAVWYSIMVETRWDQVVAEGSK